jgi:3-phosphoshikimate 1-carboxyvinyltransferase
MYLIKPLENIKTQIEIPPDKSISHRAVIISSIAKGKTVIKPFLLSDDTIATLECVKKCGVKTNLGANKLVVEGKGLYFPVRKKTTRLYAKESGTTMRVLSGVLAGQKTPFLFTAASALEMRPMGRITVPLRAMRADIVGKTKKNEEYPPLTIKPVNKLKGIRYKLPIASAQVKSALIFASLYAKGKTEVIEPMRSRDHTERMLLEFGAKLRKKGKLIACEPSQLRSPGSIFIPSDFSSAAFFIVLGLILQKSELLIKDVNVNPTRCGLLKVLKRMGANIKMINKKDYYEPYADILVKSSRLSGVEVKESEIPLMIDEIPILCVAASFARGKTRILGVGELKVKETDRIKALVYNLKKAGVKIASQQYVKGGRKNWKIIIEGNKKIKPGRFRSFSDHRTAMSMIVLGKALNKPSSIDDTKCINKSFPQFVSLIESL